MTYQPFPRVPWQDDATRLRELAQHPHPLDERHQSEMRDLKKKAPGAPTPRATAPQDSHQETEQPCTASQTSP